MRTIATLCLILLASPADAQGLKKNGDKAILKSSGAIVVNGKTFEKVVLTADSKGPIDWDYDEDAFPETRAEVCLTEKKLILFPVAKGQYRVRLLLWDEKKFQKITLIISGPDGPPVPPGPIDPPVPPQPPVKEVLGFVTMARAELASVPAAARPLAAQLADNFEAMSAKLAATASMTVDQANAELRDRHRASLGASRDAWLPWFAAWKVKADALNASGQLSTTADYVTAFRETATGLR